jgi:hypothetical protein
VVSALEKTPGQFESVQLNNVKASTCTLDKERQTLIECILKHLDKRLGDLSQGSILSKFSVLDPSIWPVLDRHNLSSKRAFVSHGKQELVALYEHYADLFSKENISKDALLHEFVTYKTYAPSRKSSGMRNILLNILMTAATRSKFPGLSILMEIYLIIPVNTACCERGFSCMKRVKNDWRSSLNTLSLNRLIYLSLQGPHPDHFDARAAVYRWWSSGRRKRRPGFSPWEAPSQDDLLADLEAELQVITEEDAPETISDSEELADNEDSNDLSESDISFDGFADGD